ncbi:MAG TPA: amylo-alpha-1,6-glucosidase [Chitinivibrionales bacterium]|nr:amylo-alpha-1,6-glucosidase [Chitinivibrionales bacterium]
MKFLTFSSSTVAMILSISLSLPAGAENFVFTSGISKYDNPFKNAKANIDTNTVQSADGSTVFNAGAFWAEVWERDGSYSIEMACGHLDPVTSKNTFNYNTAQWNGLTVQRQDVCGHFGGWPNLTDGIVWATGAWAYYRETGDQSFLSWAYPIVRNSLAMAETPGAGGWVVLDKTDSLYRGCSSFMESNSAYPPPFAGNQNYSDLTKPAVGNTKCGSTNMLYYHAWVVADSMAKLLGKPQATLDSLSARALTIKNAINKQLWNPAKGYYYYIKYQDGKTFLDRNEGLADAFAILYDIADSSMKESILSNTVPCAWGYRCQYPQDTNWMCYAKGCPTAQDADYYHTGMVWPFVQGYIAWAATKIKNMAAFTNCIDKLAQLWAHTQGGEFLEFYRPEQGTPDGGHRQLWSASGYISMVFHGLFGMNFDVDGIRFDPMVPDTFKNAMTLDNFIYRKDTLNMTVTGPGKYLASFTLDGAPHEPFFSGGLAGKHTIVMNMSNTPVAVASPLCGLSSAGNGGMKITASSARSTSLTFGSCKNVKAAIFLLDGRCAGEFTSGNGSIVIARQILKPGAYIIKWNSGAIGGMQKVLLK